MYIENHQFKATIRALTESDLDELISILGIPRNLWHEKTNYKTEKMYGLQYAYGTAKQSVYIHIGKMADSYMHPTTRDICVDQQFIPAGYEPFHREGYLLLHGSYFDHAPNFNLELLLNFLERVGHSSRELDVAFCDDQGITRLEDWLRVFDNYRKHVIGNLIRKQKILVVRDSGHFERVQLGAAKSKTMYGTLYLRPNGTIRLELKMRNAKQISELLENYKEDDRTAYHQMALCILTSTIDIITEDTKRTRLPNLYVREPFWSAFLVSDPKKLKWKEIKKKTEIRKKTLFDSYNTSLKSIVGRINSMANRYADHKNRKRIAEELISAIGDLSKSPLLS